MAMQPLRSKHANSRRQKAKVLIDPRVVKRRRTFRRSPFSEDEKQRLVEIQRDLWEVYPRMLEQWEHRFRCSTYPAREFETWLHIAACYRHFTEGQEKSTMQQQDIFQVIVLTTGNGKEVVAKQVRPRTMTRKRVARLLQ